MKVSRPLAWPKSQHGPPAYLLFFSNLDGPLLEVFSFLFDGPLLEVEFTRSLQKQHVTIVCIQLVHDLVNVSSHMSSVSFYADIQHPNFMMAINP